MFRSIVLLLAVVLLAGCGGGYKKPAPKPTRTEFRLTHHVGGTHYCAIESNGRLLAAFGPSVLVLDPKSLAIVHDVPMGEFGDCGPVIDLLADGETLWAVVEDDEVVVLEAEPGQRPEIVRRISSSSLGIRPRKLSRVDDALYVSGPGGVVHLEDGTPVFSNEADCGAVAKIADGLGVCVGRRVYRISDGSFVGAASDLLNLPSELAESGEAALAFALRSDENSLGGLMTEAVREIAGSKSTVAMPGAIERLRVIDRRLFLVAPARIDVFDIVADTLTLHETIDVLGARDVAKVDDRTVLIVGTAGRGLYQLGGPSSTGGFLMAEREASRLTYATGDGLNILAGSKEGAWMYLVNARAELTKRTIEGSPVGERVANVAGSQASISADGKSLNVKPSPGTTGEPWIYTEQKDARLHTVVAIDGDFWVGHDRGITILRADGGRGLLDPKLVAKAKNDPKIALPVADPVKERLRIPGPVLYLFPMLAGSGATYVSELGGFGAAQFIDEFADTPMSNN